MATESDNMRDFLADSDKLIKSSEKSLKKIEKVREEIGLQPGASKEFLEHIPSNADKTQKAKKELKKFMDGAEPLESEHDQSTNSKKNKKRSKLAKAMNRKLRI